MFKFDRLKALRNARNLSQARVATHLNISREAYSMYETGKRQPSNELMIDMARFFNVSLDYLIGLAEVPDSYADMHGKALYISRTLTRLDTDTLNYLAHITKQSVETLTTVRRISRAAETPAPYGRQIHRLSKDLREP